MIPSKSKCPGPVTCTRAIALFFPLSLTIVSNINDLSPWGVDTGVELGATVVPIAALVDDVGGVAAMHMLLHTNPEAQSAALLQSPSRATLHTLLSHVKPPLQSVSFAQASPKDLPVSDSFAHIVSTQVKPSSQSDVLVQGAFEPARFKFLASVAKLVSKRRVFRIMI